MKTYFWYPDIPISLGYTVLGFMDMWITNHEGHTHEENIIIIIKTLHLLKGDRLIGTNKCRPNVRDF